MIILRNKYYSEEKKDKEPSKDLNIGVGTAVGGSTGFIGGSYIGSKLEKKILEKHKNIGRENLKKDLIDLVGEKGYKDLKDYAKAHNKDLYDNFIIESNRDKEFLEELLDARRREKVDLSNVGVNGRAALKVRHLGPSNVPRDGQRFYKFDKNQMKPVSEGMYQIYSGKHKFNQKVKAGTAKIFHGYRPDHLARCINDARLRNLVDIGALKSPYIARVAATTGLTAAGLATGAYIGKKHYDKKKKEIEEKIRDKNK